MMQEEETLYGGVTSTQLAIFLPLNQTTLGLGLGYDPAVLPRKISIDWTQDTGFLDLITDTFTLGWTIPPGHAPKRSQSCTMRNTRGQNREPLAAIFDCRPFLIGG